ncbi:MAG TPA: hypothetical protein VI636_09435 [Candidatus Angelobacter sp.]
MRRIASIVGTALLSAVLAVAIITACGGGNNGGGNNNPLSRMFTFNPNPIGPRINKNAVSSRIAGGSLQSVVEAQAPTPGGGNFPGFCSTLDLVSGRAAAVIFGIGRWSTAACSDGSTPDSDVGVTIPTSGQVGNLTVDAVGSGTGSDSGQMEVKIIHADGTQAITSITCSLGVSNNAKVHCEDLDPTHHTNVLSGDQVSARIFWNPGDTYRAVRVNIVYATPTF